MPATFPGQQPVSYTQRTAQQPSQQSPAQPFTQNPSGGWNIGPAQAPSQPGMPARQQAPVQGGQPQMSHMGPWHTNPQGEYTRYYTNQQGDMNPGVTPGAALGQQAYGGEMIKRADGSYSKRGLWDNIRANKGSGKKPTKEMLEQEHKINAQYAEGGEQDETQQSIMAALKQGMKPQEILQKLVAMGLTKEQAVAYIKSAVAHPASQYDNTYVNDSNYNYMDDGGEMAQGGNIEDYGGGMFAYGGIHLDPAKKGTFKAQATRMGMSVQQAASHILANKEDYSPAMVKKANFAKNFAKEFGGNVILNTNEKNLYIKQIGGEKHFDPTTIDSRFLVEPNYVAGLNSKGHYGYDGKGTINYNPNDEYENINNPIWLGHEKYHHYQTLSGKNPKERRQQELNDSINKMIKKSPELQFIPQQILTNGIYEGQNHIPGAEDLMYEDPSTLEGEARLYEDYINNGGKPMFKNGGYVVKRSNARKGKTHVVIGPDGTKKYFGDPNMGQHPKDPERKKAFYARHKHNLEHNPYFRAYARATWAEGGEIGEYKHGGYVGMDGKFHMAKGSGTFSGNAYYANGGEEDPNLTAPYDGSNPNTPLPPFDPSAYQAMQLPTGYVGYSKKDPATGQFVPIDNVRKDDLWKHLSGSQRWNTGQTVTQKVGRAAGDVGNAVNYGIAAAGAYSNYLQNNEKQNEYNNYMQNMGTTASLYGPSAVGTSRGDYSTTGSSYGQFRPNQMGNFSWKGTTSGTQYGAYGGQTMYTIGGGVFDALLTDSDASSPVVYNPLANMPSFRQPNAVDNTYVNQPAYKLKGLPGGSNNEDFGEKLASHESGGRYNALPWADSSHTKLASSAAGKYQFLWNTHKDKIRELTGVSSKEQFLNSPDAQEAYFDYWDNNVLTPEAMKLKKDFNLQLPLDKIKAAVHQAGVAGARKYFSKGVGARDAFGMDTGKYINQFQEGGVVEMSDTEIKQFLANGGQLEFLD